MFIPTVDNYLMVELHSPMSAPSIGEATAINCSAILPPHANTLPTLTLTHPNGTQIFRSNDTEVSFVLDPVEASDAGQYICNGVVTFRDKHNLPTVTAQTKSNITLKRELIRVRWRAILD